MRLLGRLIEGVAEVLPDLDEAILGHLGDDLDVGIDWDEKRTRFDVARTA